MSVTNDALAGGSEVLSTLPKNTLENFATWALRLCGGRSCEPRRCRWVDTDWLGSLESKPVPQK